ncbi:MAG: beta-carotene 15,15'-monooxygenase [Flavobacteriaceae bacterium]|nr:beta-carotene 15,15'-monooxygenase [Flavobacteriaceae bacterium]
MANSKSSDLFVDWVPEWMVRIILFVLLMPSIVLFFLPAANANAAAGYFGCDLRDIQFSVSLLYAGFVSFYSLERRFFTYLATKEYFIIFNVLQIVGCVVLYNTQALCIIFPIRFLQGMLFASTVNLSISTMYARLESSKAREISFSCFYGILICATPVNQLITSDIIDQYDYAYLYKIASFSFIPGLLLILLTMRFVRLNRKLPLYGLDWESFVLFAVAVVLLGYVAIYGQQYYWFEDATIRMAGLGILLAMLFFVWRQKHLKRPYINWNVWNYRNFKIGLVLLFILYLCRFASGITNVHFVQSLRLDPKHLSYLNVFNLIGLIAGVVLACVWLIQKRAMRLIWSLGFLFLLLFHVGMYLQFAPTANQDSYFVLLFFQGIGVGVLMVPIIIYCVASVPLSLGASAAAVCLAVRYFGYTCSIAIMNYYSLYSSNRHLSRFLDYFNDSNPMLQSKLAQTTGKLQSRGLSHTIAQQASDKLLLSDLNKQITLRYAMDYFELLSWLLVIILILVLFTPYLSKTWVYLKSRTVSPF